MNFTGRILLTGGSGTLGVAFMEAAKRERWDCKITVFSRDWVKHKKLEKIFPEVTFVVGDVLNYEHLKLAMVGHDLVIHMAAMKHVVIGEGNAISVFETNVVGSQNVCQAAVELDLPDAIFISTDKAAHPTNAYGASKMMMERIVQQYADQYDTRFHLARYGNVWGSTGAFIHYWKMDLNELGHVRSTDAEMSRFWLTTQEALELIWTSLHEPSGCTLIPVAKATWIGDVEKWLVPPGVDIVHTGIRPGEKRHECLLTEEEGYRAQWIESEETGVRYVRLWMATVREDTGLAPRYSSNDDIQMTREEFLDKFNLSGDELYANDHS